MSSNKAVSTGYFIRRLIRHETAAYTCTAMAWILWNDWPLLPGILAKIFFDVLAGRAPFGLHLFAVVALLVASGIGRAGMLYAAARAGVPMRFRMRALLQHNILSRILSLPGAKALSLPVGEAVSTLRDDVEAGSLAADWPYDAAAAFLFIAGGLGILLWVDARVTLLVFLPIALLIGLGSAARSRLVRVREQSREATARVTGTIGDIFGSVQAIQVAGAEGRVVAHLRRLCDARRRAMVADRLQGLVFDAAFQCTMNLGAGLVLLVASAAMRSGAFSVGDFALFATYLMQVADFTGFLGYLISSYQQSSVSFRRMHGLLQGAPADELVRPRRLKTVRAEPAAQPECALAGEPFRRLEIRDLTYVHPGGRGIHGISFTIECGTVTAITGRVGSGKTTLVRALLGLLEPQAGEIRWNGRTVAHPEGFLVPPKAAYVPQVPTLLSGTLADNVLLGMRANPDDLSRAAHLAVLDQDLERLPRGWDTLVGSRGFRLSGGQVLRVAAARAFVHRADLQVLDDISSALDVDTEESLWERVFGAGGTYLVVTSRPSVLRRADRILVMEGGRIAHVGRFDQLEGLIGF